VRFAPDDQVSDVAERPVYVPDCILAFRSETFRVPDADFVIALYSEADESHLTFEFAAELIVSAPNEQPVSAALVNEARPLEISNVPLPPLMPVAWAVTV
jgi:hypothetical protein